MMPRVKICGLTRQEDVALCLEYPVHCLGFVVEYPHTVPWNLTRDEARRLLATVPPFISTALVVGGRAGKITQLAMELHPHIVQLHGGEDLDTVARLTEQLQPLGIRVLKALGIKPDGSTNLDQDPIHALALLEEIGIDGVVVDASKHSSPAGGTGKTVDWNMARELKRSTGLPVVLAGGLRAENIAEAIQTVHPFAVDILSGVENQPGQKDASRLNSLFASLAVLCPGFPSR